MEIKVLYHDKDMEKLCFIGGRDNSNAIDLYTAEDYEIEAGNFGMISLGITIDLPDGYKADIRPRSSTFSKFGLIQTNHVGLIDTSYSGRTDIIKMPIFSLLTQKDIIEAFKQYSVNMIDATELSDTAEEDDYMKTLTNFSFRKTFIPKGTRLCQMEIFPVMEDVEFVDTLVEDWKSEDRGGFGSTGK